MSTSHIEIIVQRGNIVESVHRAHAVVMNHIGQRLQYFGNAQLVTFARSTAKLLQVIPIITSGAVDHYEFTNQEITLMCASHNGEHEHTETVLSILQKIGLTETELQCGSHAPYHQATASEMSLMNMQPSCIHNNCSGKHAGMLAYARFYSLPIQHYISIDHPVQQAMLAIVCRMCGLEQQYIHLGIDGCGVPVFGMPIQQLAYAFARLGKPEFLDQIEQNACHRIIAAIRQFPHLLAGNDRYDTKLIVATNGKLIGKMGAEGMFAVAYPDQGLGLAVKIEDGAQRALYPAVTECLKRLNWIDHEQFIELAEFHTSAQRNWRGDVVGNIHPIRLE